MTGLHEHEIDPQTGRMSPADLADIMAIVDGPAWDESPLDADRPAFAGHEDGYDYQDGAR
jgi:hypothetical protein